MKRRALVLVGLLLAGCTYYPTIEDIGGIRIRPQNGRAVRQPTGLAVTWTSTAPASTATR